MENLCKTSGRNESGAGKQILLGIGILIACVLLAAGYFLFARPALLKLRYKLEYEDVMLHQAEESNLDPALVASVIFCESGYDKNAKSPVGARGLMQLMPATAQEVAGWLELAGYSESMLTDPEVNIRLGCRYLAYLIEEMGSVRAAVCAYNAGPGKTRFGPSFRRCVFLFTDLGKNRQDALFPAGGCATINTIFRNEAFLMRIVVKVGTSTLAHPTGRLNIQRMEELCKVLSDLKNAGHEIILVSSGAIGMGVGKLNLPGRPKDMPTKQAAAAVGQCELMYTYDKLFNEYSHTVAQVLLTGEDVKNEHRSRNMRNTIFRLLELGALPVINENDAVATDEIGVENTIGENDTLSAIVAAAVGAELLILLSDIDGLYDSDPHKNPDAKRISTVPAIDDHILALGGGSGSALGTGGMATKLHAAQIVTAAGCEMVIANGQRPELLYDIVAGKPVGTRFLAREGA